MIECKRISKYYGKQVAIAELDLSLTEPGIYCLLGCNGAGKTTLMKMIAGRSSVTEGTLEVDGKPVGTLAMPQTVRYLEAAQKQFNMRLSQLLTVAKELDPQFDYAFAAEAAKRFHLDLKKRYNALSFGMKTMVTTLLVLASDAPVLLLDEPVLGLDARMRREFCSLLSESFARRPRILIVSTHLIDELAGVADRILILDRGKLLLHAPVTEVCEKAYKLTGRTEAVEAATVGLRVLSREQIGKFTVAAVYDRRRPLPEEVECVDLSTEELFLAMIGGENHD